MATSLTLPGVYTQPAPRVLPAAVVRTDIAGFVGFEPRFTDGTTPSRLTGSPPAGHEFRIDVRPFTIAVERRETQVPETIDYVLSQSAISTLLNDGDAVAFGLAIAASGVQLFAVAGALSTVTPPVASEDAIRLRVRTLFGRDQSYTRLAEVEIRRVIDQAVLTVRTGSLASAVCDAATPSHFTGGSPPTGHDFRVNVQPAVTSVNGQRLPIPLQTDFVLSQSAATTLLAPGQAIVFTLAAILAPPALVHLQGTIGSMASAPSDDDLGNAVFAALGVSRQWLRLVNARYRRAGEMLNLTIEPTMGPAKCDDFRDYVRRMGPVSEDGFFLGHAARGFFANNGSRCWITTVSSPQTDDATAFDAAREEMIGVEGAPEETATGLERLLLIDDVAIIDTPDLYARKSRTVVDTLTLPPSESARCFGECDPVKLFPSTATAARSAIPLDPIYGDADVLDAQRRMLLRVMNERWRVILLMTAPLERDPVSGEWHGPTMRKMQDWRAQMVGLGSEEELSAGAFYFPWLLIEEEVNGPIRELPPTAFAVGVMARKDLARGPWVSPGNETVRTAVGTSQRVDDAVQNALYPSPENINVIRPFAGYGLQIWGARTLSRDMYLRYIGVRRGLSAIERMAARALENVVFEPNTMLLWIRVNQVLLQILTKFFDGGAFRGTELNQCFYIRCDATNNTAQTIKDGQMTAEVGVALAAPAEFIVFRLGRKDGVVEVLE